MLKIIDIGQSAAKSRNILFGNVEFNVYFCTMQKRIYTLDETFFENIDSEEKAYWLGFIFADGCIIERKQSQNVLAIKLGEFETLEKFSKSINSNKPIGKYVSNSGYNKGKEYYQLTVISNKIVEDLSKLGCVPRKSLVLQFPNIDEKLVHHFIRGYFDGDGSIYYHYPKGYTYLGINICGTFEFLNGLLKSIKFDGKCLYKEFRKKTNCWNIKFLSNVRCIWFLDYIYKDSTIWMERKRETFNDYNKLPRKGKGIV